MTNKLIAAGCLMALTAAPVFAEETVNTQDVATQKAIASAFSDIDANHDMKINMEELSTKGVKLAKFKKADINNDGSLSEDEFVAYSREKE